jgi:hypothetical protein
MQLTAAEMGRGGDIAVLAQASIPELGTLMLRKRFIESADNNRPAGIVAAEVFEFARQQIRYIIGREFNLKSTPVRAFGLGRGITDMGNGSNRQVHGRQISLRQLTAPLESGVFDRYHDYTVAAMIEAAGNSGAGDISMEMIYRQLEKYYAVQCYAAVLNCLNLNSVTICGTGLRYGVFFRIADGKWDNIEEYLNQ